MLSEFCKVDFLCNAGDPNWLGWIVITAATVWLVALCTRLLSDYTLLVMAIALLALCTRLLGF